MKMGNSAATCVLSSFFLVLSSMIYLCKHCFILCFVVSKHPELESQPRDRIQAALDFAHEIEDFDNLVDPRRLYAHSLGPQPTEYVLEKIHHEEKSMYILFVKFLVLCSSFLYILTSIFCLQKWLLGIARRKHAHIKGMKNKPLSQLTADPKRQKLNKEKGETLVSSSVQTILSFPTPSLEVMAVTPPITRSKEKSKIGKSLWEDPATALGRAYKVITNDNLKGLTSIPSHELVSCHIHKLVQAFHLNLISKFCCSYDFVFQLFLSGS